MHKLLKDVMVLDVGRYVAGPYCATLLGYLGAEVIRIEKVGGSEDRFISPLFRKSDGAPGEGGLFMQTACNKKSVAIDLASPEGRDILRRLTERADIIVANLPPRALTKLGLDYAAVRAANPRAILVTQTAFGTDGPDRDKGGFDGVGQAMSGAMHLTGASGTPIKSAAPYVDFSTAVMSAFATLAALMQRAETGEGQHVETSLLGTALAVMNAYLAEQAVTKRGRTGTGNRVQTSGPSDVFKTRDGHVLTHVVGDNLFARCARLIGAPEWLDDPRFQSDQDRGDHRDALCERMSDWCAARTTDEAIAALEEAGVPAGPVFSLQEALDNPQVEAMNVFKSMAFPGLPAPAPVADLPARFSAMTAGIETPPPETGQHTEQILLKLGYSVDEVAELAGRGVIQAGPPQ